MANGIGRVWAANAGNDEQRPNGVGSVWIENIDALAPSGGASEQQINELSAAIDYVSANAGSDIVLENTPTGSQNIYTVSSENTALRIKGTEVVDVTNRTSGIYIYHYNNTINGVNGRYEIPFTVSANAADPDAKTMFYLNTTDYKNGGFKAQFDTSGNSNASGFAFNLVDSNENIVSINSIRNAWGWMTLPNCPVDVSHAGYPNLNEYHPISAELSPGDYKLVISSIDAELVPSFSGWYYLNVQNRGSVPVSSAPYLDIPNVKLVDSKIDLTATNLSSNGGTFVVRGGSFDFNVGMGGHLSAVIGASAIFTNGSLVSADSNNGFLVSAGNDRFISAAPYGIRTKNYSYDIKADSYGLDISSNNGSPLRYRNGPFDIKIADNSNGYVFNASSRNNYSTWIDNLGVYGFSAGNYIGSFGCWQGNSNNPVGSHYLDGVGFSSVNNTIFGVYGGGKLKVSNYANLDVTNGGNISANNSCSAIFTNGSRTEITNGHTLLVGINEIGSMNGILVSGNGIPNPFISIYNGGSVKVTDGNEVNLTAATQKIGNSLNASGSQFVSADGEGVSAWKPAPMTVMGIYNQTSSNAAFVIGNGTGGNARSDLFVIDYSGNAKSNDFIAAPAPIVHTVTGNMTTSFTPPGVEQYYYEPILSGDIGVDLTKVSFNVDLSNLDDGLQQMIVYEGVDGSSVENLYNWYNSTNSFKQNLERPFSTSSTFTGYTSVEGDPSSLESVSSIRFVLDTDITIPYTATWVEEVAPKSLTELYNAFTAYTASHP